MLRVGSGNSGKEAMSAIKGVVSMCREQSGETADKDENEDSEDNEDKSKEMPFSSTSFSLLPRGS